MSWQTINKILGLTTVDPEFARRLLANPLVAVQEVGFDLTPEEQQVLGTVRVNDIAELSRILVERFADEQPTN